MYVTEGHVYITNEAMTGVAPIFVDDRGMSVSIYDSMYMCTYLVQTTNF